MAVPQTSAGIRGDQCIVAYGDVFDEETCYDESTQLELCSHDYLWDGEYDFSYHENEVEVDVSDFNLIWEDSGYDDVKELEVETCFDTEVETCYYDAEVENCSYDDEVVYCYDAEVEDFNYDAVDYFEL